MGLQEQIITNQVSNIKIPAITPAGSLSFRLIISKLLYSNRIYDDVPGILKYWKEQCKIPIYVGVGSADFLVMVLTNTNYGNILPFFNGHMNIMDFDGTRANKDFKKLASILRLPPEKILYLTRFRQDCKKAIENGLQSVIVLRPEFDSHGLISQLRAKRGATTSVDGAKGARGMVEESSPPMARGQQADLKPADIRKQYEDNLNSLSLIEDHEENDLYNNQSSQIVETDLTRYSVILSLAEIQFR